MSLSGCRGLTHPGPLSARAVPLVVHRQRLQVLAMALLPSHLLFGALTVACSATAALGTVRAVHGDTLAYGALLVGWFTHPLPPCQRHLSPTPTPAGPVGWSGPSGKKEEPSQLSAGPSE